MIVIYLEFMKKEDFMMSYFFKAFLPHTLNNVFFLNKINEKKNQLLSLNNNKCNIYNFI